MRILDLKIDVTDAANLGEEAFISATVHLPEPGAGSSPLTVCFAKPGAGFSRKYFTTDLPGPALGCQAEWHARRGWIFVSVDHLGVGDSSLHDPARLTLPRLTAANHAAEQAIVHRLSTGTVAEGFPAIGKPVLLGIGQSMGGCLTVAQQGRFHTFDGIGVLGFSVICSHPPVPPGEAPNVAAWRLPGHDGENDFQLVLNEQAFRAAFRKLNHREPSPTDVLTNRSKAANRWLFYFEDVLAELDKYGSPENMPWLSATIPGFRTAVLTPGLVAPEAAAVNVPVLIAAGERDVIADPKGEIRAYISANSVDSFICPEMAHMHNFAGTRSIFWQRIHTWGDWVSVLTREFASNASVSQE